MRNRYALLGALAFAGLTGAIGVFLLISAASSSDAPKAQTASVAPTAAAVEPTAEPATPEPEPTPDTRAIVRLIVPRLNIDAKVIVMGVDKTGAMETPPNATDVAWYNFSAHAGQDGNVVMAGHVDYINYGPAVFWRLRDLVAGDEIQVQVDDGTTFEYRVDSSTYYDEATAPVADIVGPTAQPALTLITCGGVFDSNIREYNQRLVIRSFRA